MTAETQSTILVVGATRGTGRHVVDELLAAGARVRVAARSPDKARALFGERVEVVQADLLRPLPAGLFTGVAATIFTAAVPPRPAGRALIRATEVEGLRALLARAHADGFHGRFVYMTTTGVHAPNWMMALLGLVKRGILEARQDAEALLRASGLDVAIVRAATLTDGRPGEAPVLLVDGDVAMSPSKKITRADAARVLVEALDGPPRDLSAFESAQGRPMTSRSTVRSVSASSMRAPSPASPSLVA